MKTHETLLSLSCAIGVVMVCACAPEAPRAPADLHVASATAGRVTLQWRDRADDEDSVHVERSLAGAAFVEIAMLPADTQVYSDTTAPSDTAVSYRVRMRNAHGTSGYAGPIQYTVPGWWSPDFAPATWLLGQGDFFSATEVFGLEPLEERRRAGSVAVSDGRLFLADMERHRVLVYDEVPGDPDEQASLVVGQADLRGTGYGQELGQFLNPTHVAVVDGRLFVMDSGNGRLQYWDAVPDESGVPADGAMGKITSAGKCRPDGLNRPAGFTLAGGRLIIADAGNSRVLIWNRVPRGPGTAPDVVLGQADLRSCDAIDDDPEGSGLARLLLAPSDVWSDGTRLVVADPGARRVLIWATFPTRNFAPADLILGQSGPRHMAANDDDQDSRPDLRPSARTFSAPTSVESDGVRLFVTDTGNHRVLVWDSFPTRTFTPADGVFGQSTFHHSAFNDDDQDGSPDSLPSPRVMKYPGELFLYGARLYVHDVMNWRVLGFVARARP